MKTTLRLFALAASLSFFSGCSSTDDDNPAPTPSTATLSATWNLKGVREIKVENGVVKSDITTPYPVGGTAVITETKYQLFVNGVLNKEHMHEHKGDTLFVLPRSRNSEYFVINKLTAQDLELKSETVFVPGATPTKTSSIGIYQR